MRKFFIDESGDLGITDPKNRFFVICAIEIFHDNRLKKHIKKYLQSQELDEVKASKLTESE